MNKRKIFDTLLQRLQEPRRFIQCLIGPRQVGKTAAFTISSQEATERKDADAKECDKGIASAISEENSLADALCSQSIPDEIVKVAGITTLARQAADALGTPIRFISADLATLRDISWLQQQWEVARELANAEGKALLIVDEIQKIPNWSDMVKFLWDQDTWYGIDLSVLILSSSPRLMQKGLSKSLTGRFEIIPITH